VEKRHRSSGSIVEIIGAKLDVLTIGILSGTKLAREAMTDLLKFTFNILLHYPKVCVPGLSTHHYCTNLWCQKMVECEPQNLKGKGKESPPTEDGHKVLGDYWSSKLDGSAPSYLQPLPLID
jgi:hypothetical protein